MVGTVGNVQLWIAFAPIDKDAVRTIEPSGALFSVDAAQVFASLAEAVDVAFPVAVGDPDVSVAPKGLLINRDQGR